MSSKTQPGARAFAEAAFLLLALIGMNDAAGTVRALAPTGGGELAARTPCCGAMTGANVSRAAGAASAGNSNWAKEYLR